MSNIIDQLDQTRFEDSDHAIEYVNEALPAALISLFHNGITYIFEDDADEIIKHYKKNHPFPFMDDLLSIFPTCSKTICSPFSIKVTDEGTISQVSSELQLALYLVFKKHKSLSMDMLNRAASWIIENQSKFHMSSQSSSYDVSEYRIQIVIEGQDRPRLTEEDLKKIDQKIRQIKTKRYGSPAREYLHFSRKELERDLFCHTNRLSIALGEINKITNQEDINDNEDVALTLGERAIELLKGGDEKYQKELEKKYSKFLKSSRVERPEITFEQFCRYSPATYVKDEGLKRYSKLLLEKGMHHQLLELCDLCDKYNIHDGTQGDFESRRLNALKRMGKPLVPREISDEEKLVRDWFFPKSPKNDAKRAKELGITKPQHALLQEIIRFKVSTFTLGCMYPGSTTSPRDWISNKKKCQPLPKRRTLEMLTEKGYFTFKDDCFTVTEKTQEI